MGETMLGRFKDRSLNALLFAEPYLRWSPDTCWVAVLDENVVGYCITVADTRAYQIWNRTVHRRRIIRHIAKTTIWRSPGDLLQILRWDTAPKLAAPPDLLDNYPAHFHIDVSPSSQRLGIGRKLLTAAVDHLQTAGIRGIHLRTTSRNIAALALYKQLGFSTLTSGDSTMWRIPGVRAILLGKRL